MALVPISRRCAEKALKPPIRGPCQSLPDDRSVDFVRIPSRFIRSRHSHNAGLGVLSTWQTPRPMAATSSKTINPTLRAGLILNIVRAGQGESALRRNARFAREARVDGGVARRGRVPAGNGSSRGVYEAVARADARRIGVGAEMLSSEWETRPFAVGARDSESTRQPGPASRRSQSGSGRLRESRSP